MRKRLFCIAAFVLVCLCASKLHAQLPYGSNSGINTNSGMSGLDSFMRNSSQGDGLSKYLTNNKPNSSGKNYPTHTATEVNAQQNGTGISPYMNSPLSGTTQAGNYPQNKSYQSGLPNTSGLNSSNSLSQQYLSQSSQTQNLLSDYNLQNNRQPQTNQDDIAQTLANIMAQINSLQQKIDAVNYNNNAPAASSTNRYINTSSPINLAAPSDMYSGMESNSGGYSRNNSSQSMYQSGIDSSSSRMGTPQYDLNNYANTRQQDSSYSSLDEIKAKLDEMSKSIDTHLQTNNNTSGYGPANPARNVEPQNNDFRSYSQSQFDRYYNTAQDQLRRGNYYEAADSFTLACVYEPENPVCYAGQGHALFAAGQFVSSALYIIRAIELNPDYMQTNTDLMLIIGSRDVVISRTNELEQLMRKAPASGLQILAAYVYYRTGRLADARQIINAVYQETPNSRAALALKIAIDSKINYSR